MTDDRRSLLRRREGKAGGPHAAHPPEGARRRARGPHGPDLFSDPVLSQVYRTVPYSRHGQPDTSHAADGIFRQAGGNRAVAKLARRANGRRGFTGRITLGVAT